MWITFSNFFEKSGKREIEKKFFASVLSPFLNKAINLAILHRAGKRDPINKFIIFVKWLDIDSDTSSGKVPESSSIPAAYEIFVFEKRYKIIEETTISRFKLF